MVSNFVLATFIGQVIQIKVFCENSILFLFFILNHFHKSSPTLLQEIYFPVFHMSKKYPKMDMDVDLCLNLATF